MLQFNELRIVPDGKHLIIDVQVQDLDYYENVYIDSICFDVQSTYSSTGPSSKAVVVYEDTTEANKKQVRLFWDIDLLQDNLFFVYAIAKGTPSDDTPCGMKDTTVMSITYNQYPIYAVVMKSLHALDCCNPAFDFINFSLRLKAFDLSLKTGNYTKAIEYWKKFFMDDATVTISNCGCNG